MIFPEKNGFPDQCRCNSVRFHKNRQEFSSSSVPCSMQTVLRLRMKLDSCEYQMFPPDIQCIAGSAVFADRGAARIPPKHPSSTGFAAGGGTFCHTARDISLSKTHQCIPRREPPARIDDKTVFTARNAEKFTARNAEKGLARNQWRAWSRRNTLQTNEGRSRKRLSAT